MKKPVLVIMAAGMGSRYGGLKQMDPVGPDGELIIDYSVYDAVRAGFEKVVFIIKHEIEREFREAIGDRVSGKIEVAYAFQELGQLPPGYSVPEGRVKPWGTTHAVLSVKKIIDAPFAVINADDYYGPSAYRTLFDWLAAPRDDDGKLHYSMVGYKLRNTLSDSGGVTRGVCETNEDGYLKSVVERKMIERAASGVRYSDDGGATWVGVDPDTIVSMNFWGLTPGFFAEAERNFSAFLDESLPVDPQKCEFLLPSEIDAQIRSGAANVKVLESSDVWYGVTYKEDKPTVVSAIASKTKDGLYPSPLWG